MTEPRALVIDGAQVIDGTGAPPVPDGRVVIRGDRIVDAGPRPLVPLPEGAEVIDGAGRTVLPGLIDVHVHDPSPANLALYVRNGVTSIRFAGGQQRDLLALRERVERGEIVGPRVFSVGSGVDSTPHAWPGSHAADSPIEARRLVRRMVEVERVDAILATHRVRPAVLAAICETAHELGVPVTGQLWETDAREAAGAGIDGLENTSRIPESSGSGKRLFAHRSVSERIALLTQLWAAADRTRTAELAYLLAERAVALAPELVSFEAWAGISTAEVEADPDWPSDPGDPQVAGYRRHNAYISKDYTAEDRAIQPAALERYAEFCRDFHDAGGPLVAGTDLSFGGILLHRELRLFRAAGLTATQAIRTATRQAASALGRDDLGFLQAGRTADLIVVRGDPLADLAALRRVEHAIIGGRRVVPAAPTEPTR